MSKTGVDKFEPFIPASTKLPEITVRGVILGILLAILLAASSTYVGLKIARTIAGSIPAALISMVVLRRFKKSNILENNMVQTIASAGEAVAAGVIFTVPALIIMGAWQSFNYFQTTLVTIIGGVLGVIFSVPLRRSMVVEDRLPYPEGLATAEVLKAGEESKAATKVLMTGALLSAGLSFLQTAFKIVGEQIQYWTRIGTTAIGGSVMLSPVLMAAGYIVGIRGLIAMMVGGALTWGVAIPLFVALNGLPEALDVGSALAIVQKTQFRYVGVGVLAVGGLWGVISIMKQIVNAVRTSFIAMKAHRSEFFHIARTDRDIPFKYVLMGVAALAVPTFFLFMTLVNHAHLHLSSAQYWSLISFATLFALVFAFVCAAIAAYLVGIVGTTSLPVSGITIAAIIAFASIVLLLLGRTIDFNINTDAALKVAGIVIMFAAVVAVASMVSGDNMQDLKAGFEVGSTPWKQQLMLAIGAVVSALVIPFILQTTFEAYGIGEILPRPGMNPEFALPAPQATLMATVAKGFFGGKLPWNMIQIGIILAIFAIILDEYLKRVRSGFRFPPLLFALGIYLPLGYVTAFFVGGIINSLVAKKLKVKSQHITEETNTGILCASGIIAGEAIMGVILTIPFAYYQTTEVFALKIEKLVPYGNILGMLLFIGLGFYLYKQATRKVKLK